MPLAVECRSCGNNSLNSLVKWDRPTVIQAKSGGPLPGASPVAHGDELAFCSQCSLVQRLTFSDSTTTTAHDQASRPARQLVSQIIAAQKLRPTSLVLALGSREGRLLADYQSAGIPVLGIEPAIRLAELARLEHGIPTLCRHFDQHLASSMLICTQQADVVHMSHVLPQVSQLESFIAGLPIVLKDHGVAVLDTTDVKHLLDRGVLWSPHHVELSYFSLTALSNLFSRHGLVIHDAERVGDGGATLRIFAGKSGQSSSRVTSLLSEEQSWGVSKAATYVPRRRAKVA